MTSLINKINFPAIEDKRGELYALEAKKNIPFDIKRVYFMRNMQANVPRGFHAHINLQQVAICVSGSCRMILDDGKSREEILLNSPTNGVLIENMVWREMHDFSHDCILMVLASEHYDENDYIRDYNVFLEKVSFGD